MHFKLESCDQKVLTACHTDEIFPCSFVDFDVSVSNVVFVAPECHVSVGGRLEQHQSFSIPPALGR